MNKKISFLLFTLFLCQCSNDRYSVPTSSEEINKFPLFVSLHGYIYEKDSYSQIPLNNTMVSVGDVHVISDSNGYYHIDKLIEISSKADTLFNISVSRKIYEPLFNEIIIKSDTTKDFFLTKQNDFFPIEIGNKWVYEYSSEVFHQSLSRKRVGLLTWEVIGRNDIDNYVIFTISKNFKGYYWSYPSPGPIPEGWDSTFVDQTLFTFEIRQLETSSNYFLDIRPESDWRTEPININIERYQSPTKGDTLYLGQNDYSDQYNTFRAMYVKNIGLVLFKYYGPIYHTSNHDTYNLKEYFIH